MDVVTVVSAPFEVNIHVVRVGDRALVVDASSGLDWARDEPRIRNAIGARRVDLVHLTHVHVDHVGGAARMARLTGAPVTMHHGEAFVVEQGDAGLTGAALFGAPMEACAVRRVKEGDALEIGGLRFEILLVPGHSPAHTALWEPESRSLFCGDVAFAGGSFGRVDLPGGDPEELIKSLEKLAALDAERMYAGHMQNVERNAREALLESLDNARLMLG